MIAATRGIERAQHVRIGSTLRAPHILGNLGHHATEDGGDGRHGRPGREALLSRRSSLIELVQQAHVARRVIGERACLLVDAVWIVRAQRGDQVEPDLVGGLGCSNELEAPLDTSFLAVCLRASTLL